MPDTVATTVFLDRDGTINREKHHLSDPADLELIPGAAEGLRKLQSAGCRLIVVTNQSPIGRGLFDEDRLEQIHRRLSEMLEAQDVRIDRWYWCPHLPEDGCECRKPEPGMLRQAELELGIDLATSWVVGDRLSDLMAGRIVGATTILVATGYGAQERQLPESEVCVDYYTPSLLEAADIILERRKG